MGELTKRLLTAVIGVPILVFALIEGGYALLTIVTFVMVIGLWEFFNIMELRGYKPLKIPGYISGFLIIFSAYFFHNYFFILFAVFLFILIAGLFEKDNKTALSGMGVTILGVFYISGLLSFAIRIRDLGAILAERHKELASFLNVLHINEGTGVYAIFFVVAVIFMNDTGAYFIGRPFGKRRVAPGISPGKSWEGVLGGIIASIVTACIMWWIAPERLPLKYAIVLSIILSFAGLAGDLWNQSSKETPALRIQAQYFPVMEELWIE